MAQPAQTGSAAGRRVGLIHHHELLREGLRRVLADGGFEVLWQGANGPEASEAVRTARPDVILLEWEAPGVDVALVQRLSAPPSAVPVVVMTRPDIAGDLSAALEAGAAGCLSANLSAADFISSLGMLAHGDILISHELVSVSKNPSDTGRPLDILTGRELEILRALARGATNQEIAEQLFISQHTVKIHVRRILNKMGLRNRQQAAAYAAVEGLI